MKSNTITRCAIIAPTHHLLHIMAKIVYPVTPAVRFLRAQGVAFTPHLYAYQEYGGAAQAAQALGLALHAVIKTIVLQNDAARGLIMLMHGDREISTRALARALAVKHIAPASPAQVQKWTGYLPGGTSPFGCKTALPVYAEAGIAALPRLYINGGKRGFLLEISPQALQTLPVQFVEAAQPACGDSDSHANEDLP